MKVRKGRPKVRKGLAGGGMSAGERGSLCWMSVDVNGELGREKGVGKCKTWISRFL